MQAIQIVLDDELLAAANVVAEKAQISLSELMRFVGPPEEAQNQRDGRVDRRASEEKPDTDDDLVGWEKMAVWPEE